METQGAPALKKGVPVVRPRLRLIIPGRCFIPLAASVLLGTAALACIPAPALAAPINVGGVGIELSASKASDGTVTATVKLTSSEPRCLTTKRMFGEPPILHPALEWGPLTEAPVIGIDGRPEAFGHDPTYGALRGTYWAYPQNDFKLISADEHSPWIWQASWPGTLKLSALEHALPIGEHQPNPLGTRFPVQVDEAVAFGSGGNNLAGFALELPKANLHYKKGGEQKTAHCPEVRFRHLVRPL